MISFLEMILLFREKPSILVMKQDFDSRAAIFFIIFINDIVIDIHYTIKLFADDTSLYLIIDNPQTTQTF